MKLYQSFILSPALGQGFGPFCSGVRGRGAYLARLEPRAAVASLLCPGLHSPALTGLKTRYWRGFSVPPVSRAKDVGQAQLIKGGRQLRLPGNCPSIERTLLTGIETTPWPCSCEKIELGQPEILLGFRATIENARGARVPPGWSGRSRARFLPGGATFQFFHSFSSQMRESQSHFICGGELKRSCEATHDLRLSAFIYGPSGSL